jgi:methyltransferase
MSPLVWILGLVAIQRLLELAVAARNTRRLLQEGGREVGRAHYPLFMLLHGSWLLVIAATTPIDVRPQWWLLGVFLVLQLLRVWVILTLGRYWTTRIITVDGAPLVRRGPFRIRRHPNYWIVVGEIAVLPLAFGNWPVAVVWSVLNGLLLRHRIGVETLALSGRSSVGSFPTMSALGPMRPDQGLPEASRPVIRRAGGQRPRDHSAARDEDRDSCRVRRSSMSLACSSSTARICSIIRRVVGSLSPKYRTSSR